MVCVHPPLLHFFFPFSQCLWFTQPGPDTLGMGVLGRELWAEEVEVEKCQSAMRCHHCRSHEQSLHVQRSKAFHCGIVKLTINLILIQLELFFSPYQQMILCIINAG